MALAMAPAPELSGQALALEALRCKQDFWHFVTTYAKIPDPVSGATIDFEPWEHLRALADLWTAERQCVILKARQLGVTWLMAAYALWTALFRSNQRVLILSKGQAESNDALDKARFVYLHLPEWMRSATGSDNITVLEFARRNSRIQALPSSPSAGRSATASVVILDEFAHHEHASEVYGAVKPTIDAGGKLLVVSTANGLGNAFHGLWQGSGGDAAPTSGSVWIGARGANGFVPAFLPWSARPDRDAAWFAEKTAEYPAHLREQEYPSDASEAFIVSGRPVFDKAYLLLDPSLAPLGAREATEAGFGVLGGLPGFTAYRAPAVNRKYVIGADVAQGLLHGDASCAIVLDAEEGIEVAHLHERVSPDLFAHHLDVLAGAYPGLLGVERNNHGFVVLSRLRERMSEVRCPYSLFRELRPLTDPLEAIQPAHVGQIGWLTSGKTKPIMIEELEQALRLGWCRIGTPGLRQELIQYQRNDDGSTSAPEGLFDDRVIALAIAWQMRKYLYQEVALERAMRPGKVRVVGLW